MINDSRAMEATAIRGCAYKPGRDEAVAAPAPEQTTPAAVSSAQTMPELTRAYGPRVSGEIQRLRVNVGRRIFVVFRAGVGYVQCAPASEAIYCEAQSAESWPGLARVLTPDRVARLRAAGFAEPGRSQNYWKYYPLDEFSDAAISQEVLTILHEVYGYNGTPKLEFITDRRAE
jgi:hypothetical protein